MRFAARRALAGLTLVVAVMASARAAEPLRPEDFKAQFPLASVVEGLNTLELDERVYRVASHRSLDDLRVFNAKGEVLPFAVLPPSPQPPPEVRVHELALAALPAQAAARDAALQAYALRFERDRDRAVLEFRGEPGTATTSADVGGYLLDARSLKDRKGRLLLVFAPDAPDYAGRIEVFGSEDLVNWRALASGPLARERRLGGEAIEKNRVDLNAPPSFLRVGWTGTTAPKIGVARYEELTPVVVALPRATLAVTLGNDGRSLYADLPPALPTERLFIHMPEVNMSQRVSVYRHVADPAPRSRHLGLLPRRAPEHWVNAGTLDVFRVMRGGVEVEGEPLAFRVPTDGVRIDAATVFGAALPAVEAEWRPARIVFAARAPGPYHLAVGHEGAPASPSLDLRALLPPDDASGTKLPTARIEAPSADAIGAIATRTDRIAAQAHWSRGLLWGVLGIAVLGLAWMAWRLAAQLRAATAPPGADARR
ncbi:MAG: DUF3999 family protein [Burkholderiaceae bacterium]